MNMRVVALVLLAVLLIAPLTGIGQYPLHLMVMGLLWSFIYTSWSIMGRLGRPARLSRRRTAWRNTR